jgi:Zn-dependent protease with chaperone function
MDASLSALTAISGPAIFFDGVTSARRSVRVDLGLTALAIHADAGEALAEWRYGELASYAAPDGVLRLGRATSPTPARLEIHDGDLAAAFQARVGSIKQFGAVEPRTRVKVVGWSFAAVASALLVAMFGIPAVVERVAPLVPVRVEQRLGASVDTQIRTWLDTGQHDRFECGLEPNQKPNQKPNQGPNERPDTQASRAAFDTLVRRLEAAAGLPLPVRAAVVRRTEVNAIALPGGRVYVFEGLIDKAETPDELAGVIAHEMGHIAHRDGVRAVMQAAGLSFLFGMLIGDFSGGGAAVIAMRTVLQSSYSRETEAAADAFGAALIVKLARDPRALGAILTRIAGTAGPNAKILLSHPEARERAAAIEAIAHAATPSQTGGGPLLSAAEWTALKRICRAGPQAAPPNTPPDTGRGSGRGAAPGGR